VFRVGYLLFIIPHSYRIYYVAKSAMILIIIIIIDFFINEDKEIMQNNYSNVFEKTLCSKEIS